MMHRVSKRNVGFTNIFFNYAVVRFLSRIVLKKLSESNLAKFRKVEKNLNRSFKLEADIKYLEVRNLEVKNKQAIQISI